MATKLEIITGILNNRVKELYYSVEGISEHEIDSLAEELATQLYTGPEVSEMIEKELDALN